MLYGHFLKKSTWSIDASLKIYIFYEYNDVSHNSIALYKWSKFGKTYVIEITLKTCICIRYKINVCFILCESFKTKYMY